MTADRHPHDASDERWCAVEDALALGEVPAHAPPPADSRWAGAWERERAFYAALARKAAGDDASARPSAEELALVDAVLALHEDAPGHAVPAAPVPFALASPGHTVPIALDLPGHTVPIALDLPGNTVHIALDPPGPAVPSASFSPDAPGHTLPTPVVSQDHTVVVPLRRSSAGRWAAVVLALAAAVVLTFALRPELALRGSEGSWVAEGEQRRLGTGDELPMAVWLVADGPACAALDEESSICAGQGTVVRLQEDDDGHTRVEVRRGTVTVDGALAVQTPEGLLQGNEASRFEAVIPDDGPVEVEVERGVLQLVAPEGTRSIEPGQRVRLGGEAAEPELPTPTREPTPPTVPSVEEEPAPTQEPEATPEPSRPSERTSAKPSRDPAALLVQARARLGEGDEPGAAKAYAALIEDHPSSAEAQAARVSLGKLRLGAGKPKAALALFDRYLQRGGPLVEEALWGKIQALAALGREDELAAAVDRLARELPNSVYRTRAQALVRR